MGWWVGLGGGAEAASGGAALPRVLRASHGPEAWAARYPELYSKPVGCNLSRTARELAGLDVFRAQWADEQGRWSLEEELACSFSDP